ncbi:MAG: hypothetical protein PHF67_02775 [Candidatus Nanoarchaeia archaeon]|nr:hypothetical protein [Candidatus Nanoarchaeia archaeon]
MRIEKKGQVWIETAIYTVIGLTIIAILLAVVTPQIDKTKDAGIVRQTIDAMNILSSKISEMEQAGGNIRIIDLKISKGRLEIDAENNSIKYYLEDTRLEMSQPGQDIKDGDLYIRTEKVGSKFKIFITRYYDNINITNDNKEETKVLQAATTTYKLQIENVGDNSINQKTHMNFVVL